MFQTLYLKSGRLCLFADEDSEDSPEVLWSDGVSWPRLPGALPGQCVHLAALHPALAKIGLSKISVLQSWWRRSVDNLCSFHLKDHLKWFTCSLVILDEWAAPHFTCAVTLWWIWSRVLSRPSRPVPMAGCSGNAGQVTCIYRPVSGLRLTQGPLL